MTKAAFFASISKDVFPAGHHRVPCPWSQARVLRFAIFGVMFLLGAVMLIMNLVYESRDGFTSVAESCGISTQFIGCALVLASGGILLVDVVTVFFHVVRQRHSAFRSSSASPVSSSSVEFLTCATSSMSVARRA